MASVYIIYAGEKFEGGGLHGIYSDKAIALKYAEMLLKEKIKEAQDIAADDPIMQDWKDKKVNWRKNESFQFDYWENEYESVSVHEYEITLQ